VKRLLVADRFSEQRAGERAPGSVGIYAQLLRERDQELRAPLGRVEVTSDREHRRVAECGVAMWIAAGRVYEERAADGGVPLVRRQRDARRGAVRGDDELDVLNRSGTRLRSNRA
jgi:hypothetical protein